MYCQSSHTIPRVTYTHTHIYIFPGFTILLSQTHLTICHIPVFAEVQSLEIKMVLVRKVIQLYCEIMQQIRSAGDIII